MEGTYAILEAGTTGYELLAVFRDAWVDGVFLVSVAQDSEDGTRRGVAQQLEEVVAIADLDALDGENLVADLNDGNDLINLLGEKEG